MLWSLKYHDEFADARKEGRAKGRAEGREEGRAEIAQLAQALTAAGRSDELVPALRDQTRLDELLRDFGIGQHDEPSSDSGAPADLDRSGWPSLD